MSTTSTFTSSTPINNIKNLTYSILKSLKDSIVKSKKIPNLSNCSEYEKDIILHSLKAFTILSCGHVFYRLCIKKKLLLTISNMCPFSGCSKEVEIIETGYRRGSESSTSSVVKRMEKHKEEMSDIDDNEDGEESHKRPSNDTPENKLSSKKELKLPSSSTSSTISQAKFITNPSNFSDLYSAIVKAEEQIESRKLYEKVEKQLLSNFSKNAVEKKIERARKIYDLFSSIGENKIQQ
ncbi:44282_t:CDS:2, partial [Gigaspora margarita]